MHNPRGLALSLFGAAVFLASLISLLFLPDALPAIGMMVGGVFIWSGFLWTLLSFYLPSRPPEDHGP